MHVIVLASQKGGSSKTSLCASLAVAASKQASTLIIDTDPQKTLTTWWNRRADQNPELAQPDLSDLGRALEVTRKQGEVDLVFIDTPPTITEQLSGVIRLADLVVIPVRPSPADLWAVGDTVAICRKLNRPFVFALTQATRGASLTAQAVAALSEHGVVSQAIQHTRVIVAAALASGQTPQEIEPKGQAASEAAALLSFVQARLNANTPAKENAA
jgi:chromosome partitioning protein